MEKLKMFRGTKKKTEDKAKELGKKYFPDEENIWARSNIEAQKVEFACLEMAEWKDEQPISEQGGWNKEEPTEDGWYLVDTPDFPKNCHFIVAEWDNDAKQFYSEATDYPIEFCKWKLIKK